MLCNTVSHYPAGIDKMLFFQDNDIEKMDIINKYNNLITQGNYTAASECINNCKEIYGYFADYLNAIENRIYSLQDYLIKEPPKKRPFVFFDTNDDIPEYAKTEPDIEQEMFWL